MLSKSILFPILACSAILCTYGMWISNVAEDNSSPTPLHQPSCGTEIDGCADLPQPSQDSIPELYESFPSVSPASGHRLVYITGYQPRHPRGV